VEIIAECGVNWKDMNEAVAMIKKAHDIGLEYCKFQVWHRRQVPKEVRHCYINKEKAKFLMEVGATHEVEVFFTPFYVEAIDWLEELNVPYYKIRYKDRYAYPNYEICEKVKAIGKPFFISTIGCTYWKNAINLECVPDYPANPAHYYMVDKELQGVSDHTPTFDVFERAKEKEHIKVFEMHMCLDKNCYERKWSKTFDEVAKHL
jgi:sialic acid synthase SpsE